VRPASLAAAALIAGAAWYATRTALELTNDTDEPDWTDEADAMIREALNTLMPSPVADLVPSPELLEMLKEGEALRLSPYRLGDGGSTLGYGRYFPDSGSPPPARISRDTAEAWLVEDVEARGARWVRAYVRVPLLQHQFDALTHMAFNLSPKAFKTIAAAVNAGEDPEAAALRYVRAGTHLEAGLRNRRGRELDLYRTGTYA